MKQKKTDSPALRFKKPPHVLILEARFYDDVNDLMIAGVKAALKKSGATHETVTVPGALEIPVALQFHAFVVIGCVIRGSTTHYETVCNESARGVTDVALKLTLAVGNGILTVENRKQALERADAGRLDKGGAAALAALTMLKLKQDCGLL
jgi:6,7-dimethyl-8-ribityllumazine synthase